MKKLLYLSVLPLILVSCAETEERVVETTTTTETAPVATANMDELNDKFVTAWNTQDSTYLMSIMAEDVEMLMGPNNLSGKEEVVAQWLRPNLNVTRDLEATMLAKGEGPDMAYALGTYSITREEPNMAAAQQRGNYSFVWEPQADTAWQLVSIHLERVPEEQTQQ